MAPGFSPEQVPVYRQEGIDYIVLEREPFPGAEPVYENGQYRVYALSQPEERLEGR